MNKLIKIGWDRSQPCTDDPETLSESWLALDYSPQMDQDEAHLGDEACVGYRRNLKVGHDIEVGCMELVVNLARGRTGGRLKSLVVR